MKPLGVASSASFYVSLVNVAILFIFVCLFVCLFVCADPDWADISFGVFICIGCSGIHRSLGAHLCKVKSVNLDEWTDEHVKVCVLCGGLCVCVWGGEGRRDCVLGVLIVFPVNGYI